jgi:hypothetical protein
MSDERPQPPLPHEPEPASGSEPSQWIAGLVQEHYFPLFRLALASLEDEQLSRQVVLATLATALQKYRRYSQRSDAVWLYGLALKELRRQARQAVAGEPLPPPTVLDDVIWKLVDTFEQKEHLLCVLLYLLDWPEASAATLLHVSASAVRTQRQLFEQRFTAAIREVPLAPQTSDENALSAMLSESLQKRWPTPQLAAADFALILEQVQQQALAAPRRPRPRWLAPAAAGLLALGACLTLGLLVYLAGLTPTIQLPFAATSASTPRPAVRQAWPLSLLSSSSAISQRLMESAELWSTLWIDVQDARFGPPSYHGAPRLYRLQAWVSQPAQSIQLFGLLAREPTSLYIYRGWRGDYMNPLLGLSYTKEAAATPAALLENDDLRQMVFPSTSLAATQPGFFKAVRPEAMLGRQALVVDWRDQYGQRRLRLWIDTRTGLLLRQQEFGGDQFDLLLSDSQVTGLSLDQLSPPDQLAAAMENIQKAPATPEKRATSAPVILLPTPTAAFRLENRTALGQEPAPPGYDPRHARLDFEFPNNLDYSNASSDTAAIPANLFADGYLIGAARFGLPWMLRCARSPDGLRLAFNTRSDGASLPDDALRWLDLRDPATQYEPLPGMHASEFAFSPDSLKLAVFAAGISPDQAGIYLVTLATGDSRKVLDLAAARSLLWSPDGEFLALIGVEQPGDDEQVLVLHLRTGQIAFRADPLPTGASLPGDWPIANWGLAFPVATGDMQVCSNPPLE